MNEAIEQPADAAFLMEIQHTGKAPLGLPASPLWEFAGTYSGIARYKLTKEGLQKFAEFARDFPDVVREHLRQAQQTLDEEIAAQRRSAA